MVVFLIAAAVAFGFLSTFMNFISRISPPPPQSAGSRQQRNNALRVEEAEEEECKEEVLVHDRPRTALVRLINDIDGKDIGYFVGQSSTVQRKQPVLVTW